MPRRIDNLDILYEDDDLLVINKPAGLLVIPDRWDPGKPTVMQRAHAYLRTRHVAADDIALPEARLWVVHRLDRDTSGVLVLAKTAPAHAALSQQLAHGRARKTYLALVQGRVSRLTGAIHLPIGPRPQTPGLMAVHRRYGKASSTRYGVLERYDGYTLLQVQPETGRTHQIRVHLQAIGHPLAVDRWYGGQEAIWLSALKPSYRAKASEAEHALMARLTLHAQAMELTHPTSGKSCTWIASLPKDFAALLRNLRRYRSLPGEPSSPPAASRGEEEGLQR